MKTLINTFLLFNLSFLLSSYAVFAQANEPGSGNALDFDGVDDYVAIPVLWPTSPTEITLEAWIYPTSFDILRDAVYHGDNGEALIGTAGGGNKIVALVKLSDGLWYSSTNTSYQPNKWYHVVGVWQKGISLDLFVNGQLVNSTPLPNLYMWDPGNLYLPSIGVHSRGNYPQYFQGKIDEVRIWDYARSQTQIREDMCQKLTGSEPGLMGYWRLDEGSGSTAFDSSPFNNDGALY